MSDFKAGDRVRSKSSERVGRFVGFTKANHDHTACVQWDGWGGRCYLRPDQLELVTEPMGSGGPGRCTCNEYETCAVCIAAYSEHRAALDPREVQPIEELAEIVWALVQVVSVLAREPAGLNWDQQQALPGLLDRAKELAERVRGSS